MGSPRELETVEQGHGEHRDGEDGRRGKVLRPATHGSRIPVIGVQQKSGMLRRPWIDASLGDELLVELAARVRVEREHEEVLNASQRQPSREVQGLQAVAERLV